MILDYILIGLTGILLAIAAILPSLGKLSDGRRSGINFFTKKGKLTIALYLLVWLLSFVQSYANQKKTEEKEKQTVKEQFTRDSILKARYDSSLLEIKAKFDSSGKENIEIVSETLGKYGYALDSSSRRLTKLIIDSSKTRVVEELTPLLSLSYSDEVGLKGIELIKHENNTQLFTLRFTSLEAPCYIDLIECVIIFLTPQGELTGPLKSFFLRDLNLGKDILIMKNFLIEDSINYSYFYVRIMGEYKNLIKKSTFSIDEVHFYNKAGNHGSIHGLQKAQIISRINFLEKNNQ